ncbi:hypothetical protein ACHQM5_024800 [Ranunculus cassubicifolius]
MDKQSRSEEQWGSLKMARTHDDDDVFFKGPPSSLLSRSNDVGQKMLSFSSPKSHSLPITNGYYHHHSFSAYAGLNTGSLSANMHGVLAGARGPFTPSQWMELEHQALIYKYINANVPIPSNLLIPIRKAFNSSAFASFPDCFRTTSLGWGSFQLGFSGSNDPEPGRCRRTDGKKWRCSRDAVGDQKYCERHINRGRHRSRKPVEGQTGHVAAGPVTTKEMPVTSPSPASGATAGGASNRHSVARHQIENLQSAGLDISSNSHMNGIFPNNGGLSMLPPAINMKPKDTPFSITNPNVPCEEPTGTKFGLISTDSLLSTTTTQNSLYNDSRKFGISSDLNNQEPRVQDPFRHFIDDWPKNPPENFANTWPNIEGTQLDRTQLSKTVPMSSEFSSSSSSPALSPLRLSREFDPIQMSLGAVTFPKEPAQKQVNWIPIAWESSSSMGGPLGEVLNRTNSCISGDGKNSLEALDLMTEGWDDGLQMEDSPTGVLQKTSFGSLSNSSTGSSPRAETNFHLGGDLCDTFLTRTLVNSSSIHL